jgi:hypothetical protein
MTENCKLRKAILSAVYNISQRNFGILLILWCSFKLWWNFCLDQNLVYYASGQLHLFSTGIASTWCRTCNIYPRWISFEFISWIVIALIFPWTDESFAIFRDSWKDWIVRECILWRLEGYKQFAGNNDYPSTFLVKLKFTYRAWERRWFSWHLRRKQRFISNSLNYALSLCIDIVLNWQRSGRFLW